MNSIFRAFLLSLGLLFFSTAADAHKPSDSYLNIAIQDGRINGQWDIALRDLEMAVGVDGNGDGEITWNEVKARHNDIASYAFARLAISSSGRECKTEPTAHLLDEHTDGAYAVLRFSVACPITIEDLEIRYSLLFDLDQQHEGLLQLRMEERTTTAIFSAGQSTLRFNIEKLGRLDQFTDYLKHGIWHIWIGFDHILFLLSLLLPAVLTLHNREWQSAQSFRSAAADVLKIVTAFTVAHSITLTLASLHLVALPSIWIESAIAASVIIAALNNIFPLFQKQRWLAAFFFGLIHGFGFASVLGDLGLPDSTLFVALVGFNVGVELGQLAIVAVFLPFAYALRQTWIYKRLIFRAGSVMIALLASAWMVERVWELKLLPM